MQNQPHPDLLAIDSLEFDPQNPRLPSSVNGGNEQAVLNWMLDDGDTIELMLSIGQQGYFGGEPLLVVPSLKNEGKYTVIEGNRRLAALKLLNYPELAVARQKTVSNAISQIQNIPKAVPVIVYQERGSILDYLGFRHVTGIKEWSPLAKARYLADLARKHRSLGVAESEIYQLLAKTIGTRVDYVKRMLTGLKLYDIIEDNDFYRISDLSAENISFSLVTTALANNHIVEFLGLETAQDLKQDKLNNSHLEELTKWIFEKDTSGKTKLGESRNFRYLNKVVDTPLALDAFRNGYSIQEASVFTDEPITNIRKLLQEARSKIVEALEQSSLVKEGFGESDIQLLETIIRSSRNLSAIVRENITNLED